MAPLASAQQAMPQHAMPQHAMPQQGQGIQQGGMIGMTSSLPLMSSHGMPAIMPPQGGLTPQVLSQVQSTPPPPGLYSMVVFVVSSGQCHMIC